MLIVKELGCLACHQLGHFRFADYHHIKSGNKRIGHHAGVGLCEWHHRGVPLVNDSAAETEKLFGPSLARNPRAFHAKFGTDSALLEQQDEILGAAAR